MSYNNSSEDMGEYEEMGPKHPTNSHVSEDFHQSREFDPKQIGNRLAESCI